MRACKAGDCAKAQAREYVRVADDALQRAAEGGRVGGARVAREVVQRQDLLVVEPVAQRNLRQVEEDRVDEQEQEDGEDEL